MSGRSASPKRKFRTLRIRCHYDSGHLSHDEAEQTVLRLRDIPLKCVSSHGGVLTATLDAIEIQEPDKAKREYLDTMRKALTDAARRNEIIALSRALFIRDGDALVGDLQDLHLSTECLQNLPDVLSRTSSVEYCQHVPTSVLRVTVASPNGKDKQTMQQIAETIADGVMMFEKQTA